MTSPSSTATSPSTASIGICFVVTVIILIIGVLTREERRFTVLVHYPQIRYIRSRGDNDCGKNTVHGLSWEWKNEGELAITVESREVKYGDINDQ